MKCFGALLTLQWLNRLLQGGGGTWPLCFSLWLHQWWASSCKTSVSVAAVGPSHDTSLSWQNAARVLVYMHSVCTCFPLVPLQEMPTYNDKRRRQSLLVEQSPSLLHRSCSNPQMMYYGRSAVMNGAMRTAALMSSMTSLRQRRCNTGLTDIYKPPLFNFTGPDRRCFDTDSLRSLSVSCASSLSGQLTSLGRN